MSRQPASNLGQVVEWLVWASLLTHGRPAVHMFLPLADRGVDGILRRPADDLMVPLQVKGRTRPGSGAHLDLEIADWSLHDPPVQWILTLFDPDGGALLPAAMLTDAATILRLGVPCTGAGGEPAHRVACPLPPPPGSVWAPFSCAVADLADRLLPALRGAGGEEHVEVAPTASKARDHWMGALAEVEVMRLLAGVPELNVFKSFPDIELCEYIVRRAPDGAMRGVQVKCVGLDGPADGGVFFVPDRDLAVPTRAVMVVLGWRRDLDAFDDMALLFPAARMTELGHRTEDRWAGLFHPRPARSSRFAAVTVRREDVGRLVAGS